MSFRICGIDPAPFVPLFDLPDVALRARGMKRVVASASRGYPCRASLADADKGEELLLLPYEHQPAHSPYRASGPIFIRRAARAAAVFEGAVPEYLTTRLLSLRAYDNADEITAADVVQGSQAHEAFERLLDKPGVSYLHVHFAKPGCFGCRVDRR